MPLSSDHAMTAQPPAPAAAAAGNFLNLPPPPLSPDPQEMVEPFIKPPPGFTSGHTSPVLELPVFTFSIPPPAPASPVQSPLPTGFGSFEITPDTTVVATALRPESGEYGFAQQSPQQESEPSTIYEMPPADMPADARLAALIAVAHSLLHDAEVMVGFRCRSATVWDAGHALAETILSLLSAAVSAVNAAGVWLIEATITASNVAGSAGGAGGAGTSASAGDESRREQQHVQRQGRIIQSAITVAKAVQAAAEAARSIKKGSHQTVRRCITKVQGVGERVHIMIGVLQDYQQVHTDNGMRGKALTFKHECIQHNHISNTDNCNVDAAVWDRKQNLGKQRCCPRFKSEAHLAHVLSFYDPAWAYNLHLRS
eukprot:gene10743-18108_t